MNITLSCHKKLNTISSGSNFDFYDSLSCFLFTAGDQHWRHIRFKRSSEEINMLSILVEKGAGTAFAIKLKHECEVKLAIVRCAIGI